MHNSIDPAEIKSEIDLGHTVTNIFNIKVYFVSSIPKNDKRL
jgi:hypothetical protein